MSPRWSDLHGRVEWKVIEKPDISFICCCCSFSLLIQHKLSVLRMLSYIVRRNVILAKWKWPYIPYIYCIYADKCEPIIHGNQINIISFACSMSSTPISNQYHFSNLSWIKIARRSTIFIPVASVNFLYLTVSVYLLTPEPIPKAPIFHQIKCAFVKIDKAGFIVVLS